MIGRPRRWILLAAIAVAVLLAVVYVGSDGGSGVESSPPPTTGEPATEGSPAVDAADPSTMTEEKAIEIAREWVVEDDDTFDFTTRFDIVRDHGDTFEVSFPRRAPNTFGGEPHVVVAKKTGEVVDSWYTL